MRWLECQAGPPMDEQVRVPAESSVFVAGEMQRTITAGRQAEDAERGGVRERGLPAGVDMRR